MSSDFRRRKNAKQAVKSFVSFLKMVFNSYSISKVNKRKLKQELK